MLNNGLEIKFHMQTFKKEVMTVPFRIVLQTDSKQIEKHCKETWPSILTHSQFSMEQNMQLQQMKAYIKSNFKDLEVIHQMFYQQGYMNPFKIDSKISSVKITNTNCKMWTNDLPFLELDGELTFDLKMMFEHFFEKKLYKPEYYDKKITKETVTLLLSKSFPSILTYRNTQTFKTVFMNMFMLSINSQRNNKVKNYIEKIFKIQQIETFKKTISWKDNNILIEINDVSKLLKVKAEKNILPLVGGYLLLRRHI